MVPRGTTDITDVQQDLLRHIALIWVLVNHAQDTPASVHALLPRDARLISPPLEIPLEVAGLGNLEYKGSLSSPTITYMFYFK
jgi:hypothetical protein